LFENNITEKLEFDNIKDLKALENPTFQNFVVESMNLVDM
jgi:starch synthase